MCLYWKVEAENKEWKKKKKASWVTNVDAELTMNNGNSCGREKLCGNIFYKIKEVARS